MSDLLTTITDWPNFWGQHGIEGTFHDAQRDILSAYRAGTLRDHQLKAAAHALEAWLAYNRKALDAWDYFSMRAAWLEMRDELEGSEND